MPLRGPKWRPFTAEQPLRGIGKGGLSPRREVNWKGDVRSPRPWGYMGKVLRVDLTTGTRRDEPLEPELAEHYLGGAGFGAEYLYREVPPDVEWDAPDNRLIMWGTGGAYSGHALAGSLPVRNYTTNVFPEHEQMNAEFLRTHLGAKDQVALRHAAVGRSFAKFRSGSRV